MEALEYPLPFVLFDATQGQLEGDGTEHKTLLDLSLIPSAVLTFNWHPDVAEEVELQLRNCSGAGSAEKPAFIKHELVNLALQETS